MSFNICILCTVKQKSLCLLRLYSAYCNRIYLYLFMSVRYKNRYGIYVCSVYIVKQDSLCHLCLFSVHVLYKNYFVFLCLYFLYVIKNRSVFLWLYSFYCYTRIAMSFYGCIPCIVIQESQCLFVSVLCISLQHQRLVNIKHINAVNYSKPFVKEIVLKNQKHIFLSPIRQKTLLRYRITFPFGAIPLFKGILWEHCLTYICQIRCLEVFNIFLPKHKEENLSKEELYTFQ